MQPAPGGALPPLTTAGVSKDFLGAESGLVFIELAGSLWRTAVENLVEDADDDFFSSVLYIMKTINISTNFSTSPLSMFDCILSIYNKRICYII